MSFRKGLEVDQRFVEKIVESEGIQTAIQLRSDNILLNGQEEKDSKGSIA